MTLTISPLAILVVLALILAIIAGGNTPTRVWAWAVAPREPCKLPVTDPAAFLLRTIAPADTACIARMCLALNQSQGFIKSPALIGRQVTLRALPA
jgi:hypothetical protein